MISVELLVLDDALNRSRRSVGLAIELNLLSVVFGGLSFDCHGHRLLLAELVSLGLLADISIFVNESLHLASADALLQTQFV